MGYYLTADQQDMVPLASLMGLQALRRWVGSLPAGEFMELRNLLEYAWSQEVETLRAELADALLFHPPPAPATRKTAAELLASLLIAGDVVVVTITDGLGPDDGSPDEEPVWVRTPQAPDFDKDTWSAKVRARRRAAEEGTAP